MKMLKDEDRAHSAFTDQHKLREKVAPGFFGPNTNFKELNLN